jgi:N-acetylmuramoyl-L-alanine amidase
VEPTEVAADTLPDSSTPLDKVPSEFITPAFTAESPDAQDDPLTGITPEVAPETPDSSVTTPEQIGVPSFGLNREAASKDLASSVLSRMLWAMGSANRGVRTADFYVIKYSEVPAILVETGFISHPVESQQLKNPNYQERIAYGIASGITAYLNGLLKPQ